MIHWWVLPIIAALAAAFGSLLTSAVNRASSHRKGK